VKLDMAPARSVQDAGRNPCAWCPGAPDHKNLVLDADIDGTISVVCRSPRHQADHRQPALQRGQIHPRWAAGWWSAPACLSNKIMLMIADTGIGIAPESLARLGRPFEQVESQLTKTYHGSGLGLAICALR